MIGKHDPVSRHRPGAKPLSAGHDRAEGIGGGIGRTGALLALLLPIALAACARFGTRPPTFVDNPFYPPSCAETESHASG
jgi:hypothetical protein